MKKKVFRTRISVALIIFMLAAFGWPLSLTQPFSHAFYSMAGTFFFCLLFVVVILTVSCRYVIIGDRLKIGFGSPAIDISVIQLVKRTYNPLSSPAGSLKRLKVSLKEDYILSGKKKPLRFNFALLSPVREQEFLAELKAVNPDIEIDVTNRKGWWRFWDWDI